MIGGIAMPALSEQIRAYLHTCQHEKNLSPDTLKAYRIDLEQFAVFAQGQSVDKKLLSRYVAHLNQTFAPRSVKRKLASIRAFYGVLESQELIEESPFLRFNLQISYPKELPRTIPTQTIESLFQGVYAQYREQGSLWALRDALVLELLFDTGVRVSELCRLTPETFQLSPASLRLLIHGKGRKERMLELAMPELLALAAEYMAAFRDGIERQGAILLNRRGRPLTPQSVRQIITRRTEEAEIRSHLTPHMFRHTFATSLLDGGADIRFIQTLLGHSSIATTEIYTHVATARQSSILSQRHPRNEMSFTG